MFDWISEGRILNPKVPPSNIEAEEAILGGLMLDPDAFVVVSDIIGEDDFYKKNHQKIYTAISELHAKGQPADIITVAAYLSEKQGFENGGAAIAELMERVPSAVNIQSYANIVKEKALLRKLISKSTATIEKAFNQDYENVDSFLNEVESEIFALAETKQEKQGLVGAAELIKLSIDKLTELSTRSDEYTGVPSGFDNLDDLTAGFQAGDLIIIAARPSMGKTAFSLNLAQNMAIRGRKNVAYFSVEMAKEQLMMRMLASEARVHLSDIRIGRIKDNDWPRLIEKASVMAEAPLYIDDTSGISPYEIRAKCRRLKAQHGLDAIVVDYLQIMELKRKVDSREREVAEISKNLKSIAKELRVPVIALAQLNRGVEGRTGDQRKPVLSDLRESGSIEQDADLIMMLYREEYYDHENPEVKGLAEVLVRKHRNGPVGELKYKFEGQFSRFSKWEGPTSHPLDPGPTPDGGGPSPDFGPPPTPISQGKPKNFAPNA